MLFIRYFTILGFSIVYSSCSFWPVPLTAAETERVLHFLLVVSPKNSKLRICKNRKREQARNRTFATTHIHKREGRYFSQINMITYCLAGASVKQLFTLLFSVPCMLIQVLILLPMESRSSSYEFQ